MTNGTLLEPPTLIEASNDHIRHHFPQSDSIVDNTVVEVPALSLDKGDYYIMRLVLLHSVDSMPSFQTEGKIVGQKKIVVNDYDTPTPNFFLITFGGNWLVQVVRFISYLIGVVVVIALIVVTGDAVDTIQERHRRKQVLKELSGKNLLQFVKDDFIKNGSENIEQAHKIYNNTEVDVTKKYIKSKK